MPQSIPVAQFSKNSCSIYFQIYGQYTKDLGSFAKLQAKKLKKNQDQTDFGKHEAKIRPRIFLNLGNKTIYNYFDHSSYIQL